jgi:methionyl-tRNA formyltransferase
MSSPLRIVYFGTADFAVPPLEALLGSPERFSVLAVVSQPDKPVGRKGDVTASPVATVARGRGVTLLQPKTLRDDAAQRQLAGLEADIFIVAAYGKILPQTVLDLPRLCCLNLHGSLLPRHRGASPIQTAIAEGDAETGVCLMVMDAQVDHGPVIATVKLPIAPDDTHATLEAKLGGAAAGLLVDNLVEFAEDRMKAAPQDHDRATFTKILSREDGFVAWRDEDAATIERKLRAFTPWPGAYAVWMRKGAPLRLKLLGVEVAEAPPGTAPGAVTKGAGGAPVVTAKSGALVLHEIQPEGKKPIPWKAFLNGYPDFIGAILENSEKTPQ